MPSTNTFVKSAKTRFEKIVINKQQEIACPKCASKKASIQLSVFATQTAVPTEHPPNPQLRPSVAVDPAVEAAAAATRGTPYSACPLFVSFSNLLN